MRKTHLITMCLTSLFGLGILFNGGGILNASEVVSSQSERVITGIVKDQEGVKYYKTKNSWGTERNGDGYHYMSENYVKAKTISILVNKNSIPKAIRAKLGIK